MTSAASTTEVATPSAANVTRVRFILPPLAIRRIAPPMSIGGAAGVPAMRVPPFGEHGCHAAARCGYRHEIMASPDPGESQSATEDITGPRRLCAGASHDRSGDRPIGLTGPVPSQDTARRDRDSAPLSPEPRPAC